MNVIEGFLADPIVQRIGWVLVHSLWQEAIVGILLAIALRGLRRETPGPRYAVACAAMILMLALPALTYVRGETERVRPDAGRETAATQTSAESYVATGDTATGNGAPGGKRQSLPGHSRRVSLPEVLPWLVVIWLAGVLLLSIRLVGGWLLTQRLARDGTRPIADSWRESARRIGAAIRVSIPVRLLESTFVSVPTVVGFLRPAILFPAAMLSGLETRQVEMILAHELAHIRRHDTLVNLIQTAVETLLFYHPAVWYASRVVRAEREHCCDEMAVAACGDRVTLARALLAMEEARTRLAVVASAPPLQGRIRRLLASGRAAPERRSSGLAGGIVLAGLLLAGIAVRVAIPVERETWPATYAEFAREARAALARGDDAAAMEIACHKPKGFVPEQMRLDGLELMLDLGDAMHRRYSEVFQPPDNIESLISLFRWSKAGMSFEFNEWFTSINSVDGNERDFYVHGHRPDSTLASIRRSPDGGFTLTIDLNLDGRPELVFDGRDVHVGSGFAVVKDQAPDGKRAQWLLASPGTDPRHRAQVMLYRDGGFYLYLIDFDGDGRGDYGRSGSVTRQ